MNITGIKNKDYLHCASEVFHLTAAIINPFLPNYCICGLNLYLITYKNTAVCFSRRNFEIMDYHPLHTSYIQNHHAFWQFLTLLQLQKMKTIVFHNFKHL